MIYIVIPENDKDEANKYVCDNIDLGATDSFIVNKIKDGNKYCVISILPYGDYAKKMIEKFGTVENLDGYSDIPDGGY